MRMSKFSRTSAAVLAAALLATACSSDDGDTTTDTDVEAPETEGGDAAAGYDWSDVNRRRAFSMAIDRELITTTIFNGTRLPADGFWPASFPYERPECANVQYNPEEAKRLWDEAGGTLDAPIKLWYNSGSTHGEWVEAVANMLKDNLGVENFEFESMEFADYLDKMDNGEIDGPFRLGWAMDYPSPGNFLAVLHGSDGGYNRTGHADPAFDEAAAKGDALPIDEAMPHYIDAANILCDNMPIVPMMFGQTNVVWSENVSNVEFDPFERLVVSSVQDEDGDGEISMYICEPQGALAPAANNDTCGNEALNALFTGLVELSPDGELEMAVAESIETTDGGATWEIKLKDGWTFHDGTPVTANSFVDAWNWGAYGPNGSKNSYYYGIPKFQGHADLQAEEEGAEPAAETMSGLVVNDDLSFTVSLDGPFAQFPLLLLHSSFNPLPQSFFETDLAEWGENPVGNGPFKMAAPWEHDVQIATEAYADYAGAKPSFEKLTFKIYNEDTTAYNDLRTGALDIMDTVPAAELANFEEEFAGRHLVQQNSVLQYLGFPIDLDRVKQNAGG